MEQINEALIRFNELEKLVNYNQQNLMLTWAILSVIVATLALSGFVFIKEWVNRRVTKELEPIKKELIELQEVNRQLINDYNQLQEYGTWTPYFKTRNYFYLAQRGNYYKIGNIIMVWFELYITEIDKKHEGYVTIDGLPFKSLELLANNCILFNNSTSSQIDSKILIGEIIKTTNEVALITIDENMNKRRLKYSDLEETSIISGSFFYRIDD